MIGSLSGKIIYKSFNKIEISTNGIGWEVYISPRDYNKISLNQKTTLHIYHHIAEKTNHLYGFLTRKNKNVFEMLLSVSGIGPKIAMEIFSTGTGEQILNAISQADVDYFQQVKGLGKKGAQRIIVDLKTKVGGLKDIDLKKDPETKTIYNALLSLGFNNNEAVNVIKKIPSSLKTDEEKIKYALKSLAKPK